MREFPYYYLTCHKPIKRYSASDPDDIREMFDEVIKELETNTEKEKLIEMIKEKYGENGLEICCVAIMGTWRYTETVEKIFELTDIEEQLRYAREIV